MTELTQQPGLFRNKVIDKQALQFAEDGSNWAWVYKFMGKQPPRSASTFYVEVETLEGPLMAKRGDWIVRGIQGEFNPVKPDIFAQSYKPVEAGRSSLESERQAIMKSLSITFDSELGAEGQGYEAPAEPEPQYFETLDEAVEFEFKLVASECDKTESENERLREALGECYIILEGLRLSVVWELAPAIMEAIVKVCKRIEILKTGTEL